MARLEIFVHGGCASEQSARLAAEAVRREFPSWEISLRRIRSSGSRPPHLVATPAFILDGRLVAVGVPRTEWLLRTLRTWIGQPHSSVGK